MFICQFCDRRCKNNNSLKNHEVRCKANPNKLVQTVTDETRKKLSAAATKGNTGRHYTVETREKLSKMTTINNLKRGDNVHNKISKSMKLAHAEGRAWNIGMSRWNNIPSYPETFFIKVIDNEFVDKDYIREYGIGIYSADFCWPHLNKVIEIDGDQHQRFIEYKERDIRKDKFLTDAGYQILRIVWKEMYNDPKRMIAKCYEFIHV